MTVDAGLLIPSYGSYFRIAEQPVSEFLQVVETARALETGNIRVWAGRQGSGAASEEYAARVQEDSRAIADMANEAGITVSYEYHNNTLADTLEATLKLTRAVARPNIRSYWQVNTANPSLEHNQGNLCGLLPFLSNVHVFHMVGKERRPLSEGQKDWGSYLDIVRESGRSHWFLLEFVQHESDEVFLGDAQTLKRLLSA